MPAYLANGAAITENVSITDLIITAAILATVVFVLVELRRVRRTTETNRDTYTALLRHVRRAYGDDSEAGRVEADQQSSANPPEDGS